MKVLLDTSVLVDFLRGKEESKGVVDRARRGELDCHVSALTEAELFAGKECEKESKREQVRGLISLFTKHNIDNEISQKAGEYKRKYGVPLADCMIAATASLLNAAVLTKNVGEFKRISGMKVEEPY